MKARRLFLSLVAAVMLICMMAGSALAATESVKDSAGNVFFGGENAVFEGQDFFSGFGSGKDLLLKDSQTKDVIALAGYNLDMNAVKVGSSAFAAGYDIDIEKVNAKGNMIAAGYDITMDGDSSCNSAMFAACNVTFNGSAKSAYIYAQNVTLNGTIDGDAVIEADHVVIGEDAVVTGELKITGSEAPEVDSSAKIGKLDFNKVETDADEDADAENAAEASMSDKIMSNVKSALYWIVAMVILGLILCFLFPNQLNAAVEIGKAHKGAWIASGLITLIITPILVILMCISFVGIPTAIMTAGFYGLFLAMATAFTGAATGRGLLNKMNPALASLIGIAVFELIMKIPYVGFLLRLICSVFMLGFVIQYIWRGRKVKKNSAHENRGTVEAAENEIAEY